MSPQAAADPSVELPDDLGSLAACAITRTRGGAFLEAGILDPALRGILLPIPAWSR